MEMPKLLMLRIFLILFLLATFSVQANSPLSLNKQLGLGQNSTVETKTPAQQLAHIQQQIAQQQALQANNEQLIHQYSALRSNLTGQLDDALTRLIWSPQQDLSQQASMSYLRLSELKEIETDLGARINELIKRQQLLPKLISDANQLVIQHKKATNNNEDELSHAQKRLYAQTLSTLESELASSQKQISIAQQQLTLVRRQLLQQERLIEELNSAIADQRHQTTAATIAASQIETASTNDVVAIELNEQNQRYGLQLQALTLKMNQAATDQEKAETQYQFQAKQLTNIQQQIALVKLNSAFGERFLRILSSLPKPPNQNVVINEIANARIHQGHDDFGICTIVGHIDGYQEFARSVRSSSVSDGGVA